MKKRQLWAYSPEFRELRRENARLKAEREILYKATAFFAGDARSGTRSSARRFVVAAQPGLNRRWAADITYMLAREGWLYLAVVLDLALSALREGGPAGSVSRKGDCWDGETNVTSRPPRDHVTAYLERLREFGAGKVTRQTHQDASLGGDDFVAHEVEPDHPWAITLVEMAADGVADRSAQRVEVVRLRHDRCIDAARDVAAFGSLRYHEQNLSHVPSSSGGGSSYSLRAWACLGES